MKKHTRFFLILLAVLTALSLPLGSLAERMVPDDRDRCSHSWDHWKVEQKPTCTERGVSRAKCKWCGANGVSYSAPTGHSFGEWTGVLDEQVGTVVYERTCSVCGAVEFAENGFEQLLTLTAEPGWETGDTFAAGESGVIALTVGNPTNTDLGNARVALTVLSESGAILTYNDNAVALDSSTLPGESSLRGDYTHTASELDGEYGPLTLVFTAFALNEKTQDCVTSTPAEVLIPVDNGDEGEDVIILTDTTAYMPTSALYIEVKSINDDPWPRKDDVVEGVLTVTNTGDTVLTVTGGSIQTANNEYLMGDTVGPIPTGAIKMAPDSSCDFPFRLTVTDDDAYSEELYRSISLRAMVEDGESEEIQYVDSNTEYIIVPVETGSVPPVHPLPANEPDGLTVEASVDGAPTHEGDPVDYYVPNDVVMFMVFVSNSSDHTYTNVTVYDPLVPGSVLKTYDEVGPGFSDTIEVPYTVTKDDPASGVVVNYADIEGYNEKNELVIDTSEDVTVYVGTEEEEKGIEDPLPDPEFVTATTPFGVIEDITVTKEETSFPAKNGMYSLNEVVEYTITVTNNGEIPVYNVRVYDEFNFTVPQELLDTIPVLNPSDSRTYTYKHKVTSEEMYGILYNSAFIKYCFERAGGRDEIVYSDMVIVYTGDIIDPPHFPTPMDGDSCVLTLTGEGAWEQHYCPDHEDVKKQAAAILAGSTDADAYKQVRALWQAAAEEEYNDLYDIANPAAKAVALNDRMCFFNEVTAAENLVLALTGDEALAAKTAAAMLENRCCSLCYELHNAPADRSELAGFSAFTAANECAYTVTGTGTNDIAGGLTFCAEHAAGDDFAAVLDDMLQTLAANDAANETVIRYYITSLASRRGAHEALLSVLYLNDDTVDGMLRLNDQMRIALICGIR